MTTGYVTTGGEAAGIHAFTVDPESGAVTRINEVRAATLEAQDQGACGDVQVHPSGKFVYSSLRGRNGITICRIAPDSGAVEWADFVAVPAGGLDELRILSGGRFLLAPCAEGLVSFAIDGKTGVLERIANAEQPCAAIAVLAEGE